MAPSYFPAASPEHSQGRLRGDEKDEIWVLLDKIVLGYDCV
jgi:hypothetical protein